MKKLYNNKGKIHPSPPSTTTDHHLSLLPAAIITLAATLSPEDKEVLAYLISCSGATTNHQKSANSGCDHLPEFHCNCFKCYISYWVRWDSSPKRQLIHEIIDAYEDGLLHKKNGKNKRERRKRISPAPDIEERRSAAVESVELVSSYGGGDYVDDDQRSEDGEVGSVRKIVNFIGEKIWGVWGI